MRRFKVYTSDRGSEKRDQGAGTGDAKKLGDSRGWGIRKKGVGVKYIWLGEGGLWVGNP
jgi:hypothetical protein